MAAPTTQQPNDTQVGSGSAATQTTDAHLSAAAGASAKFQSEASNIPSGTNSTNGVHAGGDAAGTHPAESQEKQQQQEITTQKLGNEGITNAPDKDVNGHAQDLVNRTSAVSQVRHESIPGPDGDKITGPTHSEGGKDYLTTGTQKYEINKGDDGKRSLTAVDKQNNPMQVGDGKGNAAEPSSGRVDPPRGIEANTTKATGSDKAPEGHDTSASAPPNLSVKPGDSSTSTAAPKPTTAPEAPKSQYNGFSPSMKAELSAQHAGDGHSDTQAAGGAHNAALHADTGLSGPKTTATGARSEAAKPAATTPEAPHAAAAAHDGTQAQAHPGAQGHEGAQPNDGKPTQPRVEPSHSPEAQKAGVQKSDKTAEGHDGASAPTSHAAKPGDESSGKTPGGKVGEGSLPASAAGGAKVDGGPRGSGAGEHTGGNSHTSDKSADSGSKNQSQDNGKLHQPESAPHNHIEGTNSHGTDQHNQPGTAGGGDHAGSQGELHSHGRTPESNATSPSEHGKAAGAKGDVADGKQKSDKQPTTDASASQSGRQQPRSGQGGSASTPESSVGDSHQPGGHHSAPGDHQTTHPDKGPQASAGKQEETGAKGKGNSSSQGDSQAGTPAKRAPGGAQAGEPQSGGDNHPAGATHNRGPEGGKVSPESSTAKGPQGAAPHEHHETHEQHLNGSQSNQQQQQPRNNNPESRNLDRRGGKANDSDKSGAADPDHQKGQPKPGSTSTAAAAQPQQPGGKTKGPEAGHAPAPEHEPKAIATAVSDINKVVKTAEGFHRDHADHADHADHSGRHADQTGQPKGAKQPGDQASQPKGPKPPEGAKQPPAESQQPAPPRGRQPVPGQDTHGNEPPKGQTLRGGIRNDDAAHPNKPQDRQTAQQTNPLGNIRNDVRDVKQIIKAFEGNNEDRNKGNHGDLARQAGNPHDAPGAMTGRNGNDRAAQLAGVAAKIAADGVGRQLGRNAGADAANYKPLVKDAAALVGLLAREFGNNRGQNGQNPNQQMAGGRNNPFGPGGQMGPGGALGIALKDIGAIARALEGGSHARDVLSTNAGGLSVANLDAHAVSAYSGAPNTYGGDGHGGAGGAGGTGSDGDGHGGGVGGDGHGDGSGGDGHAFGDVHGDTEHGDLARHGHGAQMTALELTQALVAMALAAKQHGLTSSALNPGSTTAIGALGPNGELDHNGKHGDKDKEDDHLPGSHLTHVESAAMLAPGLIKFGNLPKPDQVGKPDAVGKGDNDGIGGVGKTGRPDAGKDTADGVRGGRDGFHPGDRGGRGLAHDISGMMSGHTAGNRLDLTEGKHGHRKDDDEDDKEGLGVRGHRLDPKEELAEKIKKKAEKDAADEIAANARSVMIAAMLNSKNKQNAANKDEKLGLKDTKKKGEDKRVRYVVKEKETLETIAKKQLRDVRLAALIYEINKHMLPLRNEKGKQVADPRPGTPIWLPSDSDIRDFRARMYSGDAANAAQAKAGAKSAEDELSEKFGANWDGSSSPGASAIQANLMGAAVAKSQVRQSNIEKVLGPINTPKAPETGRIRYIVRLSDTVDGVAVKHPALKDADLWPLLAKLNSLPSEVDGLGKPVAQLRRGMVLDIPSPSEIDEFRSGLAFETAAEGASDPDQASGEMDPILRDLSSNVADAALAPLPESKLGGTSAPVKPFNKPAASVTASLPALQTGAMGQGIANTNQPVSKLPDIAGNSLPGSIFQPYQQGAETLALPAAEPEEQEHTQLMSASSANNVPSQIVPSQYFNQAAVPPDLVSGGLAYHAPSQLPYQNATAPMPASQAPRHQPAQQMPHEQPVPTTVDSPMMPQPVMKPVSKPSAAEVMRREPIVSGDRYMWELERGVRLVKSALRWDPNVGVYRAQLEVLYGGTWYPVIFYEVFPQGSVRHEYLAGGKCKSVNMDLPPIAVQELADNDVVNNWSDYCKRFINHLLGRG